MKKLIVLALCLAFAGATAWADNYNPPPWYDAQNDSMTVQGWEFGANNNVNDPLPDWVENAWGVERAMVTPGGTTGAGGWIEHLEGRNGVWGLSGLIEIPIWNDPILRPEKVIWVQLTWMQQEAGGMPSVEGLPIPGYATTGAIVIDEQPADQIGPWMHSTFEYRICPNPEFEIIQVAGDIFVDEVVVHTWCMPEPITASLFVFGGLMALRRKRA